MFLSEWRESPSTRCLAGKKNLMTSISMLLKSRASLTCFRASFLPGRAKDLSAPWYNAVYFGIQPSSALLVFADAYLLFYVLIGTFWFSIHCSTK